MSTEALSPRVHDSGVDAHNPWPGLVAFSEELQWYFHGRTEEADELFRRVDRTDLTVLFGQSGLGKSSLLQAGLFPLLRAEGSIPVLIRLDHSPTALPLADQVTSAIARAVASAGGREDCSRTADESLWAHFHRRDRHYLAADGRQAQLVLVFDQFEELFAIGHASEESRTRAQRFLIDLADLVENRVPERLERQFEDMPAQVKLYALGDRGYRAVICLREDYLPHLESQRSLMPSVADNRMRLTRMSGIRALEAVVNPGPALITLEVGHQVVRFVAGNERQAAVRAIGDDTDMATLAAVEIEPSLLSLVCRELNNRRLSLGLPRITSDLVAGNRDRILQDFYERCMADQPDAVRAFVEDELVTDSGLRENIALERAKKALTLRGAPGKAIDELVKRRLLHLEDRLDVQRVELTHDVLTAVVKRSRDQRQQQEATRRAEREAVEAREKARQQRKKQRFVVVAMALALLVVGTFGAVSYHLYRVSEERLLEAERQRQEAKRQQERAEREERDAKEARAEAVREKERAEEGQKLASKRFDEKRQAMDNILAQFSDKSLNEQPGTQQIRKVLFQRGINTYEKMFAENINDVATRLTLADRYTELGKLQGEIDTLDAALEPFRKAENMMRQLVQANPTNDDHRFRLALLLNEIATSCFRHKKKGVGEAEARESIRLLTTLSDADSSKFEYRLYLNHARNRLGAIAGGRERDELTRQAYEGLKQLVSERPNDLRVLDFLCRATINRGHGAVDSSQFTVAEQFFGEARSLADQGLLLSPSEIAFQRDLHLALRGLAYVYRSTNRVQKSLDLLLPAVQQLNELIAANPSVLYTQSVLIRVHDDLRTAYQQLGNHEKAVESLQEMIRLADGLSQRDPKNSDYPNSSVEATLAMVEILKATKRGTEAAVVLDKVIKQAPQIMSLHPTSDDLLRILLSAHYVRGNDSYAIQQYDQAAAANQAGVELFARYRSEINPINENTSYMYLECCRGLVNIAKERKEIDRAIDLATRLIVPIPPETFKDSDHKRAYLDQLIALSTLYEDKENFREALRFRLLELEEARRALGGDPKSDWHLYMHVFGAFHDLARLSRKVGDDRGEFDALRNYLTETEPYVRERDHTALLKETAEFTSANLARLRETHDRYYENRPLKRFTVPIDLDGIKYPFDIYVTDSWKYLEDQFTWVEKVRGGKVPKDVVESFSRLYKIAKENKVSFPDLCVYALGKQKEKPKISETSIPRPTSKTTAEVSPDKNVNANTPIELARALATAKAEVQLGRGGPEGRRRLILRYLQLAEDEVGRSNFFRGEFLLAEARAGLALDSAGALREPADADLYSYYLYVQGSLAAGAGQPGKGYLDVVNSIRLAPSKVAPEFVVASGNRELALGWVCTKLDRFAEAAAWYRKALEFDHPSASERLYRIFDAHPESAHAMPVEIGNALQQAKASAAHVNDAVKLFADLLADQRSQEARAASEAAAEQQAKRIAELKELVAQYHTVSAAQTGAGLNAEARRALEKEFDLLEQIEALNPEALADSETIRGNLAAKIARQCTEAKDIAGMVKWTTRAADLGDPEAQFQLAAWYETGTHLPKDVERASKYRYDASCKRGLRAFRSGRYTDALPDLKWAAESEMGDSEDQDLLGRCYFKLAKWDAGVNAFNRGLELSANGANATEILLHAMETLIVAGRPSEVVTFVLAAEKKGWKLHPAESTTEDFEGAVVFYGLQAIALRVLEKDVSETEDLLRRNIEKCTSGVSDRTWEELNDWLKRANLPAETKMALEEVITRMTWDASRLPGLAKKYHDRAEHLTVQKKLADACQAMEKEFEILNQLSRVRENSESLRSDQAQLADKIAHFYLNVQMTKLAMTWTTRAADLGDAASHFRLADWYQTGRFVEVDPKKAERYRYLGYNARGRAAFSLRRYAEALPDLQKTCAFAKADADDFNRLGMCYGKLTRWEDSLKAYQRSIDLDQDAVHILNFLEAAIAADRPDQLLKMVEGLEIKGWKVAAVDDREAAFFHGFKAVALHALGKDASAAERAMRALTGKPGFNSEGWTWDELDQWLKTSKLAPERKGPIEKIIAALKGSSVQKP